MENMKKLNDLVTWKIEDYALQLSVVILGVLITFGGGNMLNKRAKAKEITNAMELIKIELETNRKSIQEIGKTLAIEQNASRALWRHAHYGSVELPVFANTRAARRRPCRG